jgi:hypothetical protein
VEALISQWDIGDDSGAVVGVDMAGRLFTRVKG